MTQLPPPGWGNGGKVFIDSNLVHDTRLRKGLTQQQLYVATDTTVRVLALEMASMRRRIIRCDREGSLAGLGLATIAKIDGRKARLAGGKWVLLETAVILARTLDLDLSDLILAG